MSQQNLNKIYSQVLIVEEITSSTTLDEYDTGKVFMLKNGDLGLTVTLPLATDVEAGWNCKFVVAETGAGSYTIRGSTFDLVGLISTTDGTAGKSSVVLGAQEIIINGTPDSVIGDTIKLEADGQYYVVSGLISGSNGVTVFA